MSYINDAKNYSERFSIEFFVGFTFKNWYHFTSFFESYDISFLDGKSSKAGNEISFHRSVDQIDADWSRWRRISGFPRRFSSARWLIIFFESNGVKICWFCCDTKYSYDLNTQTFGYWYIQIPNYTLFKCVLVTWLTIQLRPPIQILVWKRSKFCPFFK